MPHRLMYDFTPLRKVHRTKVHNVDEVQFSVKGIASARDLNRETITFERSEQANRLEVLEPCKSSGEDS